MARLTRFVSMLVLLLHATVVGVLPAADARAEARGSVATATAHVESQDGDRCPRLHDEHCQLCPLLRNAGQAGARVSLPMVARSVAPPTVARDARAIGHDSASPDRARAPPVA